MLQDRLRLIRSAWGLSQREMADKVGVTGVAWQHYEIGQNVPGGKVLAELGRHGVNLNWLLLGMGEMYRLDPDGEPGASTIDIERYRRMDTFIRESGLEDILEVSTVSHQGDEFAILHELGTLYPSTLSADELTMALNRRGRDCDERRVSTLLLLLKRRGQLAEEEGEVTRYRSAQRRGELKFTDISGHANLCLQSIRSLVREVLPNLPPPAGGMLHIRMSTTAAGGARLVQTLLRLVKARCEDLSSDQGTEEVVVVLGAAHSPRK